MDSELKEKYARMCADMARIKKLDVMLAQLKRDRSALKDKIRQLESECQTQELDVKKLERFGISAVLSVLQGNRNEALDKEHAEALAAELNLEQAKKELEDVATRIESLSMERVGLSECEREYYVQGELLKRQILSESGETAQRLTALEESIAEAHSRLAGLEEAASAGAQVLGCLDRAEQYLLKAEGSVVGGINYNGLNFDYIESARIQIQDARLLMNRFRSELAGVELDVQRIDIDAWANFAEFSPGGLITDVIVLGKIRKSQEQIRCVICRISSVLTRLNAKIASEREMIHALGLEQEALVVHESRENDG